MYKESAKSFISLVQEIDTEYRTQRDRGTLFELLVKTYLENEPVYQRLFEHVWMLSEVPGEYNIPKVDTGVDLVAKKAKTGELVAIQAKYYDKDTTIQKSHIDSFLNEVGKKYYAEGLIITTTDKWSNNADTALGDRDKNIMRISLSQLKESRIDWSEYTFTTPEKIVLQERKTPRPHQVPAINDVIQGFEDADRGKLIMAPGTGKTFTSMAIAERMAEKTSGTFKVLYLVPSIQLLLQTLRGWNADINFAMDSIAVCSDRKVTKERIGTELEDIATADIGFPATTNTEKLLDYQNVIEEKKEQPEFITVFSTYQSIDVIIDAQKQGFYDFDLVICDEAHRTTGTTELGQEGSAFTKIHSNDNIKAKKRLYQTATPRVYGEDAKRKAEEKSVVVADMNDPDIYGEELHRIGFGEAIRRGILTDYKVMVLAVDEDVIARRFQDMFSKTESGLQFDDVTKIIGCWNGLVKRDGDSNKTLGLPMKRAIAFTGTIKDSKMITDMFSTVVDEYLYKEQNMTGSQFNIEIQHADGTMNAVEKNEKIDWLKSEVPDNTCRVLSNARFLTEGVDVPDLDAVMFLKPRKSKIDIAQAVGRVMRKAEGKDYGYIILPIGVPAGAEAHSLLDNNEQYAVVWEILNALRSIDERFDATINKLELNKKKPNQISIIGVGDAPGEGGLEYPEEGDISEQLALELDEENLSDLEKAIYGKIVQKVGNVRYWEQWSEDVAKIAQQHITRINVMLEDKTSTVYKEFQKFMKSIRHNINDSISEQQAIEMLSQHLITKPVFEALFETYSFINNNPVSQAMESILELLDKQGLLKEQEQLEDFYDSVRVRAEGIDNLKAKQDIIIQLYDKFFKVGFKDITESLGIVFTPTEVVDFIIHSVEDVLKKHFGKSLASEGVHVLDPFTGTGTFITRLIQSGLIPKEDLLRKYTQEIHANEIVLLSYYIAAINIEETFHDIHGEDYVPFEGIVLTDTFESTEKENSFEDVLFNENNERLKKQRKKPIFAIIGNPPYRAKQSNEDSNFSRVNYPNLDSSLRRKWVETSSATNKTGLMDSYIRALRWSTNRIKDSGVIGFITNNSFIDGVAMDGMRKSLQREFSDIYIVNLKGQIRRRNKQQAQIEGGNIFDIMTGVTIILLVKDKKNNSNGNIYYHDIGNSLTKDEKLNRLSQFKSIGNIPLEQITPNTKSDWINQRNTNYDNLIKLGDKRSHDALFTDYTGGIKTGRDAWTSGFDKTLVKRNMKGSINYYNENLGVLDIYDVNTTEISWTKSLKQQFERNDKQPEYDANRMYVGMYRPFVKKNVYYHSNWIDRQYQMQKVLPNSDSENLMISFSNKTEGKEFSCLMINVLPDVNLFVGGSQNLPKYLYDDFGKYSALREDILKNISGINEEDVLYYIYGIFHSNDYRALFHEDLSKSFPRFVNVNNKDTFIKFGKKLAELHLNYEKVDPYSDLNIVYKNNNPSFKVQKMKHPKIRDKDGKNIDDTSVIIYNKDITIENIPSKAYEYQVNGRSAIYWLINQYQVKKNSRTKMTDDPNLYSNDEKYIFNLLLSIINVSVQTVDLVNSLPPLEIIEE